MIRTGMVDLGAIDHAARRSARILEFFLDSQHDGGALLTANMLAAWPQHHATQPRTGQVLRTE